LQAEQQRIEGERTQAHHWSEAATHEATDVREALDDVLTIVGRCHETDMDASPMLRRLMNQAMFERLLIRSDDIDCEQQPVFRHITRLGRGLPDARQGPAAQKRPRPPDFWGLGSNVGQLVHLVGQLSNPSAAPRAVFEALSDEPITATARPEPQLDLGRLGNGVVQRAIVKVLALAQRPLTVLEAQVAVVDLLGHPVSKGSINCCLSTGALGNEPCFERVSRGCYRLGRNRRC
jgi:hypothetical protein